MRIAVHALVTALLLGSVSLCSCRHPHPGPAPSYFPDGRPRPLIVAPRIEQIVLDGNLDEWHGIPFIEVTPANGVFDLESDVTDDPADLRYRFALCHDGHALYVAVEVHDDVIQLDDTKPGETHAKAWWDDAVEVFIDGNHNRAANSRVKGGAEYAYGGEFSLVANGAATSNCTAWPDSFGDPRYWQGATSIQQADDGSGILRYEYRLTWTVMGGNVRPGSVIGFTIGIQDDDDGGNRDHALYWQGITPHCWKDEAGWGDVLLAP